MKQRGKRSFEQELALGGVDPVQQERMSPPDDMDDAEKAVFLKLVNSRPPEWFGDEHLPYMEQYCFNMVDLASKKRKRAAYKGKVLRTAQQKNDLAFLDNGIRRATEQLIRLGRAMRLTQSSFRKGGSVRPGTGARGGDYPWTRKEGPLTGKEAAEWIEKHCRIPEGKFVGQPVKLTRKQKRWLSRIFDSPTRLFILSMARKNAKTAFCAFLLLLFLVGPAARRNSQLYSDAQSREQAGILFGYAAKCVRMSPTLSAVTGIRDTAKQLYVPMLGTLYRALSAEVSTSFGLSPAFVVHDELGQVRGPKSDLYDALETAGAGQEQPLSVIISTQAPTDGDLLSMLIDDALTGADPMTKCELYAADVELDPFSLEAIRQANPHFDEFMNKDEVKRQAADASRLPSRESAYRNLVLNQRVESTTPFVSRKVWQENGAAPDPIGKQKVFCGLDLSSTTDLCAFVALTEGNDVHPTFWLPDDGLRERSRTDRVPYDRWKEQGFLLTTPGKSIAYEFVAEFLRGFFDRFDATVAFDRYNMKFLVPWLKAAGFSDAELDRFVEFGQGFISMSPAIREVETKLLAAKYKHGNHPVLAMCAANAIVVKDPAENRKFTKQKATGRIDGMVALAMAEGSRSAPSTKNDNQPKKYQMFFM